MDILRNAAVAQGGRGHTEMTMIDRRTPVDFIEPLEPHEEPDHVFEISLRRDVLIFCLGYSEFASLADLARSHGKSRAAASALVAKLSKATGCRLQLKTDTTKVVNAENARLRVGRKPKEDVAHET